MSKSNYCLIDRNIQDFDSLVSSINDNTDVELYDNDTKQFNPTQRQYDRLCFIFHTKEPFKGIVFNNSPLFTKEDLFFGSNKLKQHSPNFIYIVELIRSLNIKHIDFLACELLLYQEWKDYFKILMDLTGVTVGASNNLTGNLKYGGDWILESTEEDVRNIYFNDNLLGYVYLLAPMFPPIGPVILQNTDDGVVAGVPLGGNFIFNGITYATCNVSSNGFIYFNGGPINTSITPLDTLSWKVLCPFGGNLKTTSNGIFLNPDMINKKITITFECYSNPTSTDNVLVFSIMLYFSDHPSKQNQVDYIYVSSTSRSDNFIGNYYIGYSDNNVFKYVPDANNPSEFSYGNSNVVSTNKFPPNGTISNVLNINPTSILANANDGTAAIHLSGTFTMSGQNYSTVYINSSGLLSFEVYYNASVFIGNPFAYETRYNFLIPFVGDLKTTSNGITVNTQNLICTITFDCYSHYSATSNILNFSVLLYLDGHANAGRIDYVYNQSISRLNEFTDQYYIGYTNSNRTVCYQDANNMNAPTTGGSYILSSNKFPQNGTRVNDVQNADLTITGKYLVYVDDDIYTVNLGGTFNFGGSDYTSTIISANGYIYFDSGPFDPYMPLQGTINKVISPFGHDMFTTTDGIQVVPDSDNKKCIITFNTYSHYNIISNIIVFKIVLYYSDHPITPNRIEFIYVSSEFESGSSYYPPVPYSAYFIGYTNGTLGRSIINTIQQNFTIENVSIFLSVNVFPSNGTVYVINQNDDTIKWKINQIWTPPALIKYGNMLGSNSFNYQLIPTGSTSAENITIIYKLGSINGTTILPTDVLSLGTYTVYATFTSENYLLDDTPLSCTFILESTREISGAVVSESFQKGSQYIVRQITNQNGENTKVLTLSWISGDGHVNILKFYSSLSSGVI